MPADRVFRVSTDTFTDPPEKMTPDRAKAYGRVMDLLRGSEPLEPAEKDVIREAADALLFCEAIDQTSGAMDCLMAAIELGQGLVSANRWPSTRLEWLVSELSECGPGPVEAPAPEPVSA
jgi:hypothetical protein